MYNVKLVVSIEYFVDLLGREEWLKQIGDVLILGILSLCYSLSILQIDAWERNVM